MGILSWLKNVQPEGTLTDRIKLYGLDRISGLTLAMQEQIANTIGKFAKGKLPWLKGASSEEKRCVDSWSSRISRDFEAGLTDSTEFYSLDQLPCPKAGAELALMTCVLLKAVGGDREGEAAAHINYYLLASFVDVVEAVKPLATITDAQESVRRTMEITERWRETRQCERTRLTTQFQEFISAR